MFNIYNYTMETYIKLNSQVIGKDKLARLIQYTSRALWHYMQVCQMSPFTIEKLKSLEYNFSTFRKLLRLGKSLEILYQAFKTIHLTDMTMRISITLSKIASALFLFSDHILWIGRSGLSPVNTRKWTEVSNKYWLYSIVMNLARDVYELNGIVAKSKLPLNGTICEIAYGFYRKHEALVLDTFKNSCDVWIPLTALGYTQLKPGTIGILGVISSIIGIITIVSPHTKLTPS